MIKHIQFLLLAFIIQSCANNNSVKTVAAPMDTLQSDTKPAATSSLNHSLSSVESLMKFIDSSSTIDGLKESDWIDTFYSPVLTKDTMFVRLGFKNNEPFVLSYSKLDKSGKLEGKGRIFFLEKCIVNQTIWLYKDPVEYDVCENQTTFFSFMKYIEEENFIMNEPSPEKKESDKIQLLKRINEFKIFFPGRQFPIGK